MRSAPDPRAARAVAAHPAHARRRPAVLPLLLVVIVVALSAATAVQLLRVRATARHLEQDLALATGAAQQLSGTDSSPARRAELVAGVRTALTRVRDDAGRLDALTGSVPFTLAEGLPILGEDVRTARHLAAGTDLLAGQVLPVLVDAMAEFEAGGRSGPLDLRPVTARAAQLRVASRAVQTVTRRVRADHPRSALLVGAQARLVARLDALQAVLRPVQTAADVGAAMTGRRGPRRYLVVLQTPAESRATGGLVGGFVEVVVDDGTPRIVRQGSNSDLENRSADVVTIPGGFAQTWGSYGAQRSWPAANLSPDFPSVAKVWAALYTAQFGVRVDGVVGVTPEALAQVMRGRPPVLLQDGTRVGARDVVGLLERGVYDRYPAYAQEGRRNAYQQDVVRRLLRQVLTDPEQGLSTLLATRAAVSDGSLRLASMHPVEQADLAGTAVAGGLPQGSGPFVAWTTQNASASKLDIYLHRQLSYRRQPLGGGRERARATATLVNEAPATGLPAYVTGRTLPAGTNTVLLATYLTRGATVTSVVSNGRAVHALVRVEGGHPVVLVQVRLAPAGGRATVVVVAEQPTGEGPVQSMQQLVANDDELHLQDVSRTALKRRPH